MAENTLPNVNRRTIQLLEVVLKPLLLYSSRFMQPLFFCRHPSALFADEFGIFNDIRKCIKVFTDIFLVPFAELF
jgi:hypothetical protein